ncbi:hypothetical protein [Halorarum salinum]|uniref:DUF8060 domain-containing protein n=1 Tax=Halorarum salinum TaxID=2743089 RepID=A0A7D5QIV5_9EURY|nr:hypothetical protein [Halobaculum salinum]QLG63304.1 hypothetical protein HUG12_16830 [Halobaculum salinum]
MTDTPTHDSTDQHEERTATGGATAGHDAPGESAGRDLTGLLNRAALVALVLLAVVAGLRFYLAASSTIDQWIVHEYRSLFHAAFNLVLLLLSGYGIAVQVRRIR